MNIQVPVGNRTYADFSNPRSIDRVDGVETSQSVFNSIDADSVTISPEAVQAAAESESNTNSNEGFPAGGGIGDMPSDDTGS